MKRTTIEFVLNTWEDIEAQEPDISTERLTQMVCDVTKLDVDVVMSALRKAHHMKMEK